MNPHVAQYVADIQREYATGRAREHSYRPALKTLIERLNEKVVATNEPSREKCGAPDYVLTVQNVPIGYGEAKDIGENLDEVERSEQLKRYHALGNLFLTDYLEFRFILNCEKYQTVKVMSLEGGQLVPHTENYEHLANMLRDFMLSPAQTITQASKLAILMADKARLMKEVIHRALMDEEQQDSPLHGQYEAFRKILVHDMTEGDFADVYAQTIAYGLFAARFNDESPETFTRMEAQELVPKSNPFLRKLFHHIAGPDLDTRISWIVDALADLFAHADVRKILESFGSRTQRNDPVIHFYETFLKEYDPATRKGRGVYYTPEPVVSFIVRSVDALLKSEFGLQQGLADTGKVQITVERQGKTKKEQQQKRDVHRVQILDPAVGTGTFLNETVKYLYRGFEHQKGIWPSYAEQHLLPRLHGFELMMAPYTMCHLKLGLTLRETGYQEGERRLSVYLTNSLEEPHDDYQTLFASWLSDESNEASRIKKEMPIMVVLGNPPYSGHSSNTGEWITKMLDVYKQEPGGGKLKERNAKWLNDDYVKFIRYAESVVERNGSGVVAFITNNSYLDNPTFRGMRWHLLQTFDQLYVLDLHGNSKKKEVAPDGGKDENVFDIQQGVSILLAVKTGDSKELATVYHADMWGKRDSKYQHLWDHDVRSIEWEPLVPCAPSYELVQRDTGMLEEYAQGISLPILFPVNSAGIVTARDELTIDMDRNELWKRVQSFAELAVEAARNQFNLGDDKRDWKISLAQKDLHKTGLDHDRIVKITYRPFDTRYTYYTGNTKGFQCMPRREVMQHLLQKNFALITTRKTTDAWDTFVTSYICGHKTCAAYDINYVFPLYLYKSPEQSDFVNDHEREPNMNMEIVAGIASNLGMPFKKDGSAQDKQNFGPEDIFDYIYAIFHCPAYRVRYGTFLKTDFPRVPFTANRELFWQLIQLGRELRQLHLMESPHLDTLMTSYPVAGTNVVEQVRFEGQETGKVWINEAQYFENFPRVAWESYIGGYQPAQKWLKDRKGRALSSDDVLHYQRIIVALSETDRLMKEIDVVIEQHGGFPIS